MRRVEPRHSTAGGLVMMGVSHREASVESRERLRVGAHASRDFCARLASGTAEAVLLSTCNRTEIYLATSDVPRTTALAFSELARLTGVDEGMLRSVLSTVSDGEAAAHLFAVAGGLESVVVGETQILGQLREAHRTALDVGGSGPVLDRLFRQALQTGRRIRSETRVLDWPATVPSATVRLAATLVGSLESSTALVIGAGRMSELVLLNLVHRGCGRIVVANRTLDAAARLAERFGAEPVSLDRLHDPLVESDLVVSCTASRDIIVSADEIRRAAAGRMGRPMLLMDIAVPRDLDPEIASLRGCYLYNVDDLADVVAATRDDRSRELARARAIVAEESRRFRDWQLSREVVPAITSLRRWADDIRASELRRAEAKLDRLSPAERRLVESLTAQIMNKFLHEPTVRMKQAAAGASGPAYAGAVEHLFGLGEEPR
jgi:glutamyl-tRNA reductase